MSLEGDIAIILRAEDRASSQVRETMGRVRGEMQTFNTVQRVSRFESQLQFGTFERTSRIIGTVGSAVSRLTTIYDRWNTMQIRVGLAQDSVNEAQLNFGKGSREAEQAQRRLNDALRDQQVMYVLLAAQSLTMASSLSTLVRQMRTLRSETVALNALGLGGGRLGGLGRVGGALLGVGIAAPGIIQAAQGQEPGLLERAGTIGGLALTGALIGAPFGGPVGAAVGAGVGAGAGAVITFAPQIQQIIIGYDPDEAGRKARIALEDDMLRRIP